MSTTQHRERGAGGRVAYSIPRLAEASDMSKQTLYREIEAGRLKATKIRGRLVIPAAEAERWIRGESA